ncbi:acyclic terpene utilization AtuA family protein [Vineibacter terrae]|uniref:acyclic terpene utilization AtuA family protein n=1 Tax=Vineibacter terrae TaxID=2586908 RepID=UPI002E307D37|nr:acyclic terpene utilization AtuA family protein [Vineibacter terrae]HEX2891623.1 acyclic terpene utilization AtuA family protein [Vineibacter terrae]
MRRSVRIGCGAGFSSDRLDPAVDLAQRGALDYLVFECLGERTMAFGHRDRMLDGSKGYNPHLAQRMRGVLAACRKNGTVVVTNMGAANPLAAAQLTVGIARELGLAGMKVACIEGDDVTRQLNPATPLHDRAGTIRDVGLSMVGANAYLGADALMPALKAGADIIIAGRVADPSLFLAPLAYRFGWGLDDWQLLGRGTVVGHLLECGMQVTGGYFADPGFKDVPNLADCGFPIAEVGFDGSCTITKLPDTGGCVTTATVKEQLLYEVHDPANYLTPDVTADFSRVAVEQVEPDRIQVAGGDGRKRPDKLKATIGFDGGFLAEAGVSYAGPNAQARARLAGEVVWQRLSRNNALQGDLRIDMIGINSLHGTAHMPATDSEDVRLRVAMRSRRRDDIDTMMWEVESLLCCGPAGGGGYRGSITPCVVTHSTLVGRDQVRPTMRMFTA